MFIQCTCDTEFQQANDGYPVEQAVIDPCDVAFHATAAEAEEPEFDHIDFGGFEIPNT